MCGSSQSLDRLRKSSIPSLLMGEYIFHFSGDDNLSFTFGVVFTENPAESRMSDFPAAWLIIVLNITEFDSQNVNLEIGLNIRKNIEWNHREIPIIIFIRYRHKQTNFCPPNFNPRVGCVKQISNSASWSSLADDKSNNHYHIIWKMVYKSRQLKAEF